MRQLLEGRRIGFALRPPLASVAVGLGIAVTLLDLVSWFAWGSRDTSGVVAGAYFAAIVTAVIALLGLATASAEMADAPEEDRNLARLDAIGTLVGALLYGASAAIRAFDLGAAGASPGAFLLALAGLLVLIASAATSGLLYAAREWEEIEEISHERHRRRRAAAR